MVRSAVVAGILLSGTAAGGIVADATNATAPFDWSSLVGGAIGSSPAALVMAWRLNKRDKEVDALQSKLDAANERTLQVVERAIPILAEATRTLADVKNGLEELIDDMGRGKGR